MELTLDCKTRPEGSKPNALRRSGSIPAVLYGHNGVESLALTVPTKTAELLVRKAALNNTLVTIKVDDATWSGKALLREVQAHPWKGTLYHLSFFSVGSQEFLEVDVPLHIVGEAPGVKTGGGSLDQELTELRVRCTPSSIPDVIEVDVAGMNVGDALHVHQLPLPEGVVSLGEGARIVVAVIGGGDE